MNKKQDTIDLAIERGSDGKIRCPFCSKRLSKNVITNNDDCPYCSECILTEEAEDSFKFQKQIARRLKKRKIEAIYNSVLT